MAYGSYRSYGSYWAPYVPVAQRRAKALHEMARLQKKGMNVQPVKIDGKRIARSFWGMSWCEHLEKFSDFENRLPRGRTYVRNGSVCHLEIKKGKIIAKVSGSEIYDVTISIKSLATAAWNRVRESCTGQVSSLLELLQGRLSNQVMEVVTHRDKGLFPRPGEISMECSCPDWAGMCKHIAAVMYGVGARLDEKPELLFVLRGVDHGELISQATTRSVLRKTSNGAPKTLADDRLGEVFGIDVAPVEAPAKTTVKRARPQKSAPASVEKPLTNSMRSEMVRAVMAARSKRAAKIRPRAAR